MGMDFSYQLFFPRTALVEMLEHLGGIADPTGEPTVLVLPDRTVRLPYSTWAGTPLQLRPDDGLPRWEFALSLWFDLDDAIRDYLQPRTTHDLPAEAFYDERGRARIGYVYLTVDRDLTDRTGTGGDLVLFSFGTPGSSMSVLFLESDSIRRTFTELLATCHGVYGVLDLEDSARLFWWRGREVDEVLPTAEMSLAEIEEFVGDVLDRQVPG